jgi:hypothetical protein
MHHTIKMPGVALQHFSRCIAAWIVPRCSKSLMFNDIFPCKINNLAPSVEKAHPSVEKAQGKINTPYVEKAHPSVEKAHPSVEKAQ